MTKALVFTLVIILSVPGILSCSKDGGGGGSGSVCDTNKAFAANVKPIILTRCGTTGCHAAFSLNGPGPLINYGQIAAAAPLIRVAVVNGTMPQGSSLSTAEKNSIICWIDSGAPDN